MREWVTELSKSLFSETSGLFKFIKGANDFSYFPNSKARNSYETLECLDYYRFAGEVLAKALFEKIPVNIKLNRVFLKRIVNNPCFYMEDLKDYDPQIY
jgi:hypothetical protein